MKRITIIDGNNLFSRAFGISKRKGACPLGFSLNMIMNIKKFNDGKARIVFAFDTTKSARRLELYPDYKGKRKSTLTPEEKIIFEDKLNLLISLLRFSGCTVMDGYGYEADDFIAAFSRMLKRRYMTMIVSTDNDLYQLIDMNTSVYDPFKGSVITEANFDKMVGIDLSKFLDYKCIMGDKSDNIPGFVNIGEKTSRKIVEQYGSYEAARSAIYEKAEAGEKLKAVEQKLLDVEVFEFTKSLIDLSVYFSDSTLKQIIKKCVDETTFAEKKLYTLLCSENLGHMFEEVCKLCKTT